MQQSSAGAASALHASTVCGASHDPGQTACVSAASPYVMVCVSAVMTVVVTVLYVSSATDTSVLDDGCAHASRFCGAVQCRLAAFCVHSVAMRNSAILMCVPFTFGCARRAACQRAACAGGPWRCKGDGWGSPGRSRSS